jgi:hypothetical protein
MATSKPVPHRPRELRRRVLLPARMRTNAGWADACILNVSSRGLLIHSARPACDDRVIELRHGQHAMVARVMWRIGTRAGLRCEQRVPVEELVNLGADAALQLTAPRHGKIERRKQARLEDHSRLRSRAMQFASIAVVGACLALGASVLVAEALARPLAAVSAALDPK